ncbi:MAG: hypothetical protein K8I30_05165 [Anaerolineae bacterium]|nr:hypothetical protein [Anaerolineae bacterium]
MSTTTPKRNQDVLSPLARWGEVIIIVMIVLFIAFLLYHQSANTGFFTEKFGTLEMLCVYVPLLLAIAPAVVHIVTGRRNPARPFEAATSLLQAISALWLLIVFPFSFAHLADALPEGIRFILAWVTDDLGRLVLVLQIIVGPLSAILALWRYLSVRFEETAISLKRRTL